MTFVSIFALCCAASTALILAIFILGNKSRSNKKSINDMSVDELIAEEKQWFNRLLADRLTMTQLLYYERYTAMLRRMIDEKRLEELEEKIQGRT
jgi:hypothetical protein